jgi:hypothetical protein
LKSANLIKFESLESRRLFSISPAPVVLGGGQSLVASAAASASLGGTGITGEYFAGEDFTNPLVVRTDKTINFTWPKDRPDQDIPAGGFSARWTGQIAAATTDTYTFYTRSNSPTSVTVNGVAVLDTFGTTFSGSALTTTTGTIAMTAGQKYSIVVEYASPAKGATKMQLLWSATGIKQQIVPRTSLFEDPSVVLPTAALTGYYYGNAGFDDLLMTRNDPAIDYNWGTGTPDSAIPDGKRFYARWIGYIVAPVTGKYTFQSITDDGVRLWVNGIEIVKDFNVHSAQADLGQITLQAGQIYPVRMDYFQDGTGHTSAKLLWKLPGQNKVYRFVKFILPTPVAPIDVTTSAATTTGLTITWNDVVNESGFIVERSNANPSNSGGTTFTQVGTTGQGVTSFTDTGLTPGTTYEYEIIATDAAGDSPASAPASGTTLTTTIPTAVVASATASGNTATVSWTASPTATSYLVERSTSATGPFTTVTTTANTTLADPTLAGGTTYYYRVTPSNAAGIGPVSNVASVMTVPSAPANLTAAVLSATEIDLHWSDVTGETGFIVEESLNGTTDFTQIGTTAMGVTHFPAAGLTPATHYFFRVIAIDAAGDSDPSNVANATTSAANPSYATLTTLYGLTSAGLVYSIDTTTGAAAQIGTLSFGTNAAGRDPATSDFDYISIGNSAVNISAWNPFDGSNTVIATNVPLSGSTAEAAFATDGQFFITTDAGDLYSFSTTTKVATLVGNIHANGATLATDNGDLAFAPDGTMFIETHSELYSIARSLIDAGTGSGSIITATDIGTTGGPNLQLAFGQNGALFGTDAAGQLYTVNTTTAATTPVGTASGINYGDLATVPLNADLSVLQSASSFVRGSTASYTLTVSNAGPDTTVGPITLVDTLPTGVTYVSGTGTGWTFSVSGQTVTMTYTTNTAASTTAPPVTLNVAIGSGAASNVTNSVTVSTTVFDPNTANNTGTLTTAVSG